MASNQLPVAEKARIIAESTGIPFEKVREIQRKDIADSTFEELKIRYNDPDLGKLPEWFDVEEANKTIINAVANRWQPVLQEIYTKSDLHNECWFKVLLATKKIKEIGKEKYLGFVYRVAEKHVTYRTLYRVRFLKKHHSKLDAEQAYALGCSNRKASALPEVVYDLNENLANAKYDERLVYASSWCACQHNEILEEDRTLDRIYEEQSLLHMIQSIDDIVLRDLLSITAFVLAQVDSLEGLYKEAMGRLEETRRTKLIDLLQGKDGSVANFKKIVPLIVDEDVNINKYIESVKSYLKDLITEKRLAESM